MRIRLSGVNSYRLLDAANDGGEGGSGGGSGEGEGSGKKAGAAGEGGEGEGDKAGKKPTDQEAQLLREVMEKKTKIKDLEKQVGDLNSALAPWKDLKIDEVQTLINERRESETKRLEKRGEWDTIKSQMVEQHNAQLQGLQAKIDELSGALKGRDGTIDQLTIGSAFSGSKFISEELVLTPNLARKEFGPHFERDESGKVVAYDKPVGVQGRAPLVDAQGNPLAFDMALGKLVEMHPEKDSLKKAKLRSGAGSGTQGGKEAEGEKNVGAGVSRIAAGLAAGGLKGASGLKGMLTRK
jgi:hypothetical protein